MYPDCSGEFHGLRRYRAVHIRKTEEGTKAEVSVRVLIISRITGMPINGAFVMQSSSPKIGYSGSNDSLVHEALTHRGVSGGHENHG